MPQSASNGYKFSMTADSEIVGEDDDGGIGARSEVYGETLLGGLG